MSISNNLTPTTHTHTHTHSTDIPKINREQIISKIHIFKFLMKTIPTLCSHSIHFTISWWLSCTTKSQMIYNCIPVAGVVMRCAQTFSTQCLFHYSNISDWFFYLRHCYRFYICWGCSSRIFHFSHWFDQLSAVLTKDESPHAGTFIITWGPLLLTWFNFIPVMDKKLHPL